MGRNRRETVRAWRAFLVPFHRKHSAHNVVMLARVSFLRHLGLL